MIHLKNISKSFTNKNGKVKAINDVSLKIKENEIFGIIGESGAGKSTLLRLINGLETADKGSISVNNMNIQSLNKKELRYYKKEVGMIFQHFNLLSNKTVEENVLLPLELHNYNDALDIDKILDFVDLTNKKHNYPRELSGGQKQRVGIARALITHPKILLCDEPTSALDENMKREVISLLVRSAIEFNITILVVTHELSVVKRLCERVAILDHGNLIDVLKVDRDSSLNDVEISYSHLAREVLCSSE